MDERNDNKFLLPTPLCLSWYPESLEQAIILLETLAKLSVTIVTPENPLKSDKN